MKKLKNNKDKKNIKGILSLPNDKLIFELNGISLFDLNEIILNKIK